MYMVIIVALLITTVAAQMETTMPVLGSGFMGGTWQDQNPNDPEYMDLLWRAIFVINYQLGRFKGPSAYIPVKIIFVRSQVVNGMNYSYKAQLVDSNCPMGGVNVSPENGCVPLLGAKYRTVYIAIYDNPVEQLFDVIVTPAD